MLGSSYEEARMKKKRFTEEQIIKILIEVATNAVDRDPCKQHNAIDQMFYRWRNKCAGLAVNEA